MALDEMRDISVADWEVLLDNPGVLSNVEWLIQTLTEECRKAGREPEAALERIRREIERAQAHGRPLSTN
jgi:hypothetical protein